MPTVEDDRSRFAELLVRRGIQTLPELIESEANQRAVDIIRDTYGPLLGPINDLVRTLELGPGDKIISVAIRDVNGEIRIVHIGD